MLRFIGLSLLCACASATGPEVPGTEQQHVAQTDPWLRFVDEYCGRWAETVWGPGREALFIEFYESARQLPAEQVSAFPFRVLADLNQKYCWITATQVIGFAGTAEDGERLMAFLQSYPVAEVAVTFSQTWVVEWLAISTEGLGFLASRLEETHPLRERIVDYLIACAEPDYWLEGTSPRIVFRPEWRRVLDDHGETTTSAEDVRRSVAGLAIRRCVHSLGNVGSERAGAYLEAGERGFSWHQHFRVMQYKTEYAFALKKHRLIRRLGLEETIRQGYSAHL